MGGAFVKLRHLVVLAGAAFSSAATAQQPGPVVKDVSAEAQVLREMWKSGEAKSVVLSLRLFDRMLRFSLPSGYVPIYQAEAPGQFIMEYVPDGETLENWTSMITVRGLAGLGRLPLSTSEIADRLLRPTGCAAGPAYEDIGEAALGTALDARIVAFGCADTGGAAYGGAKQGRGEQDFGYVARGFDNVYMVLIARRGAAFAPGKQPIPVSHHKDVLGRLGAVMLCADDSTPECKDVRLIEKARQALSKPKQ